MEAVNGVVSIGDARVHPGDLMRGDADGVVAIPQAHEDAVLTAAEEIDAIEQRIRAAVNEGKTLADAANSLGTTSCRRGGARRRAIAAPEMALPLFSPGTGTDALAIRP